MEIILDVIAILIISVAGYFLAKFKIMIDTSQNRKSDSRLDYYGIVVFLWSFTSGVITIIFTKILYPFDLWPSYMGINISIGVIILSFIILRRSFKARTHLDVWYNILFIIASMTSLLLIISIMAITLYYSISFFGKVSITEFLLSSDWSPFHNKFGSLSVLFGTFYIAIIALMVAVPLGVFTAVYLSEYASRDQRAFIKPIIEILSGIPTIVYGYIAIVLLSPSIKSLGDMLSIPSSNENMLSAGVTIGIMVTPLIVSLSDNAIFAVPNDLRYAALALGSTKTESIRKIVLPAASKDILCSIIVAFTRAIGETMIVVMSCGLVGKITLNAFDTNTTVTTQIVNLISGDASFDSPKTLSAFALALLLFIITAILNIIYTYLMSKNRKK